MVTALLSSVFPDSAQSAVREFQRNLGEE